MTDETKKTEQRERMSLALTKGSVQQAMEKYVLSEEALTSYPNGTEKTSSVVPTSKKVPDYGKNTHFLRVDPTCPGDLFRSQRY